MSSQPNSPSAEERKAALKNAIQRQVDPIFSTMESIVEGYAELESKYNTLCKAFDQATNGAIGLGDGRFYVEAGSISAESAPELHAELMRRHPEEGVPPVDFSAVATTDNSPYDRENPNGAKGPDGQYERYVVLTEEERAKGFVRPVRRAYIHDACGVVTTMGLSLCETYARSPKFYTSTFCSSCQDHFPVSQFKWDEDGEVVGS